MLFLIIKDFSNHRSRVQPFFARKEKKTGLKFNLPPPFVRRIFGPDFKASLASWRCNFFWIGIFLELGLASLLLLPFIAFSVFSVFCFYAKTSHNPHTHLLVF